METSKARENIMNRIRQALNNPVPLPFPLRQGSELSFTGRMEDEEVMFAEAFTKLQGKFAFCTGVADLEIQLISLFEERAWTKIYCPDPAIRALLQGANISLHDDLATCDVSLTGCEYLVARTGSMVLSSKQAEGRTASVYAPVHICIAYSRQVVYDITDALRFMQEKYKGQFPSMISFAAGPSRTADIEKTLVTGVHGPKEVYCFLVEE